MFAFLSGKPIVLRDRLILDVNGVGYDVDVSTETLSELIGNDLASLYIYTYVREDRIELYGFITPEEKELFTLLLDVSGVGPKTALAIVGRGTHALIEAVQQANVSFFTSVPRVGKKSAQKIIIELKSKLGGIKDLDLGPKTPLEQDIAEALTTLGFSDADISSAMSSMDTENISLEQGVQQAIKLLGSARK
jgi:Holliday junction DNA helicase RuvA